MGTRGFLISPDLPSGLSLDADSGVINGVPARATEEPQKFTVHVDAGIDSPALELQLSIVVSPAPGASWSSWIVTALSICAGAVFILNQAFPQPTGGAGAGQYTAAMATPGKNGRTPSGGM